MNPAQPVATTPDTSDAVPLLEPIAAKEYSDLCAAARLAGERLGAARRALNDAEGQHREARAAFESAYEAVNSAQGRAIATGGLR